MADSIAFVLRGEERLKVSTIGNLRVPRGSNEAVRCAEIRQIIADYASRAKVSCPLSIAVFGPPGSGKSHLVREIIASVPECGAPFVVNLSQLSDPRELAEAFTKRLITGKDARTNVFFFDEFDAPLKDNRLGWIRWFLAPMQDGEFFFNGQSVQIGKAVFLFAGGTAASLEEFESRAKTTPEIYREMKVPDFVSRLRGFVDIQGINNLDDERPVRRALVLRHLLGKRWPDLLVNKPYPINQGLVRSLLSGVHFVHGARSMEAFLDMCRLDTSASTSDILLPHNDLRRLHLSRGILDGKVIGISAGQHDPEASGLLGDLTDALLRNGAILAYGGDFVPEGTLHSVVRAAKGVPDELVQRTDKRIRNYLGFPSFLRLEVKKNYAEGGAHVEFLNLRTLSVGELKEFKVPRKKWFAALSGPSPDSKSEGRHLAWALSLFRMRVRLVQDVSALVVLGGKDDGQSWGRFPGIAEEVMLAIAMRKPVLVLGGRGGAAGAVGRLLGLDQTIADPSGCLVQAAKDSSAFSNRTILDRFSLPGYPELPLTLSDLRAYLTGHALTTTAWTWNGLNVADNRELFATAIPGPNRIVELIIRGLSRLDWKLPAHSTESMGSPGPSI